MRRRLAILALLAVGAYAFFTYRKDAAPDGSGTSDGPGGSVERAATDARSGGSSSPGRLQTAKACDLITATEISNLLDGPIGTPIGEDSEGKTSCIYPPADAGSRAQAEITIEWQHGREPSFERQLASAFEGTGPGSQVAHTIDLGDEAAYSMEGVLSIRSGETLVTISLPMRPGAEAHAVAVGRKLFESAGRPD